MTGRLEPKEAPAWQRRAFRYLVSFPIIGCCLCVVFAVMFLMLRFQVRKYFNDVSTCSQMCMLKNYQNGLTNIELYGKKNLTESESYLRFSMPFQNLLVYL